MKQLLLTLLLVISFSKLYGQTTPTLINSSNTVIYNKCDTVTERGYNWWSCGELLKDELFTVYKLYTGLQSDDSMHIYSIWEDSITKLVHVSFLQYYKDIPIEFAYYTEHSLNDTVLLTNGFLVEAMNKSSTPNVTESVALDSALDFIDAEVYAWQDSMEYFLKFDSLSVDTTYFPKGELIWTMISDTLPSMNDESKYVLAWKFNIYFIRHTPDTLNGNYIVYVDAQNGSIIKYNDDYCYGNFNHFKYGSRSFDTRYYNNKYYLETDDNGVRVKTKNRSFNGSYKTRYLPDDGDDYWGNDYWAATAAHWGVQEAWKYWRDVWKTNGMDHGAVTVHVHADTKESTHFDYGEKKGSSIIAIGRSGGFYDGVADIIGHEFTHGIIRYSSNISNVGEAGALNESYADIFGYLFERSIFGSSNWLVGEDANSANRRDFQNPQNVTPTTGCTNLYPRYYLEPGAWAYLSCSLGGSAYTHHNNNVQNHCFYLLSMGGTLNGITVSGIGIGKASVIAQYAMTNLMKGKMYFSDSREAWVTAAIVIFGKCSNEHLQTCKAWAACNVGTTCFCYPSPILCDRPILRYPNEIPEEPQLELDIQKIGELINIYPNPSNNEININWGFLYKYYLGAPIKINIIDQFGKSVLLLDSTLDELNIINIGHINSGIYSLCINFEKTTFRFKIVKF